MMQHKILFTSDIHGNLVQYQKLVAYAKKLSADSIIIGGDIAPHWYCAENLINGQRLFLEKILPELLSTFRKKLPKSNIFLIMGNDDCAVNLDVLERNDPSLYRLIHRKRLKLTDDFDIVGYSYVPITPFTMKDWEKYDLGEVPEPLITDYRLRENDGELQGYKSSKSGWKRFRFTPEMRREDSIQRDLTGELFSENADKTVYVFHSPPYKSNLDLTYRGVHVGSMAIKLFIERNQPYLMLHGHIHETVELSGSYKQKIGKTLCLTAGNRCDTSQLAILVFNLYEPQNAKRKIL